MDMNEVVASEMKRVSEERDRLMNHPKIRPFIRSVAKWIEKTQDRVITIHEKRNVAQCLMNCIMDAGAKNGRRLFEATSQSDISFLGIQLPVIAALLPTLVLNDVAVVQAIDRRIAAVFYLNVLHGSAKGSATDGSSMISAISGHATGQSERRYAMARVSRENVGTGNGAVSSTTTYAPGLINLENVIVESLLAGVYTLIGTCTSAGVITGDGIDGSGSINAAGVYSFTVENADSIATILLTYDYQYDLPVDADNERDGVPETNIEVTQSPVEAIDFPLRAIWSLGAQIDLQKAHGIDLENELTTYLGGEIRFAIDQYGLDLIDQAAEGGWDPSAQANYDPATQVSDWDARPSEGEAWFHKKMEFVDRIEQGSNAIFDKTKRGIATFMVCGNNVARVVKQLPPEQFKPIATPQIPTGPIKIGTLNGNVTVIQNPFKRGGTNRYTLGFRGPDYLHAGFIYAPYIPLFSTPTLTTSDLMSQKGFLSSAAFKTTNAGLFTFGDITNLQGGYVLGS
jgi:hypothetical protein